MLHSEDEEGVSCVIIDVLDPIRQPDDGCGVRLQQVVQESAEECEPECDRRDDAYIEVRDVENISLLHDHVSNQVVSNEAQEH